MQLVATRPPQVSINLLPPDLVSRQRTQRIFTYAIIAAAVLGLILIAVTVSQRLRIAGEERTLREQQARAATLQTEVASLREYEELKASVDANRALLATALSGDVAWSRFLDELDTNMPGDSWLSSLAVTSAAGTSPEGASSLGTSQFQGSVTGFPGLANWLDTMSTIDGLEFVYMSNGSKADNNVVSFSANAHFTDTLLSHRCLEEGSPCP